MKKNRLVILSSILAAVLLFFFLQRLCLPKYQGRVVEGAFTAEYYHDLPDHQVLILGDCEAYENISTVKLWEAYGITSFIRGSANQLPIQSYYLLEDALRYETPEVVVFSVSALQESVQAQETYNRMCVDGMRWSSSKWKAIRAGMLPDEHMIEYIFPLLRFHDRWKELSAEDFRYLFEAPPVSHNGYYLRADIRPAVEFPEARRLSDPELPESSMEALEKIRTLCEEKGIRLVLFKAPSVFPLWHDEWEMQVQEYAARFGLPYLNTLLEPAEGLDPAWKIDYQTDTYDGGMHMNIYGAEKVSLQTGKLLSEELDVKDRRSEEDTAKIWQEKTERYEAEKKRQEQEFSEKGYLSRYSEE